MKELIKQIIQVSEDLRHAITMERKIETAEGQKHLLALVEALKELNK